MPGGAAVDMKISLNTDSLQCPAALPVGRLFVGECTNLQESEKSDHFSTTIDSDEDKLARLFCHSQAAFEAVFNLIPALGAAVLSCMILIVIMTACSKTHKASTEGREPFDALPAGWKVIRHIQKAPSVVMMDGTTGLDKNFTRASAVYPQRLSQRASEINGRQGMNLVSDPVQQKAIEHKLRGHPALLGNQQLGGVHVSFRAAVDIGKILEEILAEEADAVHTRDSATRAVAVELTTSEGHSWHERHAAFGEEDAGVTDESLVAMHAREADKWHEDNVQDGVRIDNGAVTGHSEKADVDTQLGQDLSYLWIRHRLPSAESAESGGAGSSVARKYGGGVDIPPWNSVEEFLAD